MNWTVGKKMMLMGIVAVLGLSILAGNNFFTTRAIESFSETERLRNSQIATVNQTLEAHLTLMLNAMDAIIDKDEGRIEPERMEAINKNAALVKGNLVKLEELADTEEEKRLAVDLKGRFGELAKGIQEDLVNLIQKSGIRTTEIKQAFIGLDDRLDNYGDPIEEELVKIYNSVSAEQKEATDTALLRNRQISILNGMVRAHGNLMLAAMDSIIDKDEGRIEAERFEAINASVQYMS